MLALLGAATIAVLLALILFNRCSPLVALVTVPAVAGLIGGFGRRTAVFMLDGITSIAPVATLFVFAIVFFGVMTDAGLLDPIIARVLRVIGENPPRIVIASALLALLVHLDGSGAVCFLVVIPAMRPLYERVGIDRRVLACVVSMAAGVNFLPWTGPTLRAAAALKISVTEIFRPMIGVQAVGLAFVFGMAWWLGRREGRQAGTPGMAVAENLSAPGPVPALQAHGTPASSQSTSLGRPHLFWVNLALTLVVLGTLVVGWVPPAVAFMLGTALALIINYPGSAPQRERVDAHARSALTMAAILLAAGAFTGVMSGTGALKAMAQAAVAQLPAGAGTHIPFALSLVAMPLSMIFDPDSFYFGVLPVIAEMHAKLGGAPLQVAQAALVGQMTAGFPVSPLTPATFLVSGLAGLELSTHQKFAFPFLYAASLVMASACVLFGIFPV
jgi:CitMHS family citrate-Mg2+:H+ or citrate-Ca2+:H+ symporter